MARRVSDADVFYDAEDGLDSDDDAGGGAAGAAGAAAGAAAAGGAGAAGAGGAGGVGAGHAGESAGGATQGGVTHGGEGAGGVASHGASLGGASHAGGAAGQLQGQGHGVGADGGAGLLQHGHGDASDSDDEPSAPARGARLQSIYVSAEDIRGGGLLHNKEHTDTAALAQPAAVPEPQPAVMPGPVPEPVPGPQPAVPEPQHPSHPTRPSLDVNTAAPAPARAAPQSSSDIAAVAFVGASTSDMMDTPASDFVVVDDAHDLPSIGMGAIGTTFKYLRVRVPCAQAPFPRPVQPRSRPRWTVPESLMPHPTPPGPRALSLVRACARRRSTARRRATSTTSSASRTWPGTRRACACCGRRPRATSWPAPATTAACACGS